MTPYATAYTEPERRVKHLSKRKDRRNSAIRRRTARRNQIGIGIVAVLLIAGIFVATREKAGTSAPTRSTANPALITEAPWYRDASIEQVADIIGTSEHALIYYRSPT